MNLQPHACASPLPRVLFPHPMKPHNVMIILIPIASKKMYMKIRTTQSPLLFTAHAGCGSRPSVLHGLRRASADA